MQKVHFFKINIQFLTMYNMQMINRTSQKLGEKRERERVWCCRRYIYSVHRWIVLISDYVVPSNSLSTLTERICYPINEVRDIDLAIFLLFCIFQFLNYGEVVKLQHSEWIFFMISLMAVIDMKAFSICED